MIRDTLVIALEASWEQDPVRMEDALWDNLEKISKCRTNVVQKNAETLENTTFKRCFGEGIK